MPKTIFLFHGSNYKKGIDDHRLRVPLGPMELDETFYDPHVPYYGDNSIGTTLDMGEFADLFCDLAVGDEVYVAILPDAALYRGLWAMAFNAVNGFKVEFDFVRGRDVWNAWVAKSELSGLPSVPGTTKLPYDFTDGLGHNSYNALTFSKLPYGLGSYDAYRNNAALKFSLIDPSFFAFLGEAMYIRMTVKELGNFMLNTDEDGCCNACHEKKYPIFQVGCVYDHICADKQRWQKYCNCDFGLCRNGCDNPPPPEASYAAIPVTYKDAEGNPVAPNDIIRVYEGATVTVTPPEVDGYTTPAAQDVTAATDKVEFIYNAA